MGFDVQNVKVMILNPVFIFFFFFLPLHFRQELPPSILDSFSPYETYPTSILSSSLCLPSYNLKERSEKKT